MRLQLIDCLDNIDTLNVEGIECLLLQKERFWIVTLITMQKEWIRRMIDTDKIGLKVKTLNIIIKSLN